VPQGAGSPAGNAIGGVSHLPFRRSFGRVGRNASRNIFWYGEERRNRSGDAPTCGEIGEQGMPIGMFPVPVVEPRILASEVNQVTTNVSNSE
jgi:hypothetical protein